MGHASDPIAARKAAEGIVAALRAAGHTAYFAGGCVRDELLGLHPTDYDVATDATPDRIRVLFKRTNLVGAAFGVVLVHEPGTGEAGITVEVATFRSDGPYEDKRRPAHVTFADAQADARRRDFTINALFLDPLAPPDEPGVSGRVIDLVGGVADLRAKVVRAVGNPHQRLAEDHLRALRAARFAARLGFVIEPTTADAIRQHAAELAGVSRERIGEELRRMLAHASRANACAQLDALGLSAVALGEPANASPSAARTRGAIVAKLPPGASFVLALAAWLWERDEAAQAAPSQAGLIDRVRRALLLSNAEREHLAATLLLCTQLRDEWERLGVAPRKRLLGRAACADALALLRASPFERAAEVVVADAAAMSLSLPWRLPEPLVTGDDLIGIGLVPGPVFKRALDGVFDAQLDGRIRTKSEGLELAAKLSV